MSKRRKNKRVSRVLAAGAVASASVVLPAVAVSAASSPNPFGYVDTATRVAGGVRVTGWAIDPSTPASIDVHIYIDGKGYPVGPASSPRGDVGAQNPQYGAAHGFDVVVPLGSQVCAYGINQGAGSNTLLGCKSVPVNPFGYLDTVARDGNNARVTGWAVDPDTANPIDVHIYSDNRLVSASTAAGVRNDLTTNMPGYGTGHGFDVTVPNGYQICAYGINQALGTNSLIGCSSVPRPSGSGQMVGDLLARINDERAARGIGALAWDESLAAGARDWAIEMSRSGMRHSPSSGRDYGENIQYLTAGTSGALHAQWMNSTSHRDNIVSPSYGAFGVGIYCAPDGVVWAVERFGQMIPGVKASTGSPANPIVRGDSGGPAC